METVTIARVSVLASCYYSERFLAGFLVPSGGADEMARAIIQLIADEQQRRQFGNQARMAAVVRFDAHRMVDDYLAWYREIIMRTRDDNHAEVQL